MVSADDNRRAWLQWLKKDRGYLTEAEAAELEVLEEEDGGA